MKIGIDIDDTIAFTSKKIMDEALEYDRLYVNGKGFKNKDASTFMEMFYWNVLDINSFWKFMGNKYYRFIEPILDASTYINKLYEDKHEIVFITRRKKDFNTKNITQKWLKMNNFKYNKLFLGVSDKGKLCSEENIDLFIDNEEKNIYNVLDYGIDCILFGTDYNKDEKELFRLESWKEIYDYINEVKNNGENS